MNEQPKRVQCPNCNGNGDVPPQFEKMEDLLKFMMNEPDRHPWRPGWYYNQAGDQIEIYLKNCASVCTDCAFFTGKDFSIFREHNPEGGYGEIVGIHIHNVIGRLAAEACKAAYIRPSPRESLKCPICGMEAVEYPSGAKLIYSRDPITCKGCGTEYGGKAHE